MGRKRTPGLTFRSGVWHIDKRFRGIRLCESTGTGDLGEAEAYLVQRLEALRRVVLYGERPRRTFRQAATKYLNEATKATLEDDARLLKHLDSFIGELGIEQVHMGTLRPYIERRRKDGVKSRTINAGLQVVRHILNLAGDEWLDESGKAWLDKAPKIKLLREDDRRMPYPLSWDEQTRLFRELPAHLSPAWPCSR